ncbi:MAG: EAL domain-containing protein [Azonexus sp.]|nr:EAL domain-containing protein [Azonexus sp.]
MVNTLSLRLAVAFLFVFLAGIVGVVVYALTRSMVASLSVMLVLDGAIWLVLIRAFAPLVQITGAAQRFVDGDYEGRLPEIGGGEAGTLARAINGMLEKLAQREDEFHQAMVETLPGDFYMIDAAGRMLMWSRNMAAALKINPAALARANSLDFFRGPDVAKIRAAIEQAFASGATVSAEATLVAEDGSEKPYRFTGRRVMRYGQPVIIGLGLDMSERKQAEAALQASEANLRALLDNLPYMAWLKDMEGRYILINKVYADFLRMADTREIVGKTDFDLFAHELAARYRADDAVTMASRRQAHLEEPGDEARSIWLETYKTPIIGAGGSLLGTAGFARDITERRRQVAELRVSAIVFEAQDCIIITDHNKKIVRVNRAFTRLTGYAPEDVLGQDPSILSSGRHSRTFYQEMWKQLLLAGAWSGEIWDRRKNGEVHPKWMTISVVRDEDGETTHYVAIASDMTERKKAEAEIHNLAFYDTLTGLPNRRLLMERFRAALALSARQNTWGAALFIDLDRFKVLNDTLGHSYGDQLLIQAAARIKSCIRETDTVARQGGDEFVVLLEGVGENQDETSRRVGMIAAKTCEALARPYELDNHIHHCPPSIGISLFRGGGISGEEVLQQADIAMYQAKADGGNAVRFFDPLMQQKVMARARLENDLRHAVAQGQLRLHYQLQVAAGQQPVGAEALVRWQHPQRGMVSPEQFIPLAEESALILEIGAWVLECAARQLWLWARQDDLRHLTLAVNVSARQFAQADFVNQVALVMQRYGIAPANLKLELTESLAAQDLQATINKMLALKKLGVQLAMDDFGTGYSSLSYLTQLPLDQIKIDRRFVQGITRSASDALLVQTIIDLAKNLQLAVIAEGVETAEQLAFLREKGCLAYQGYLFGHPLPVDEFEQSLAQAPPRQD